jgi:hypothetical protein
MNNESNTLTRREALLNALKGTVAAALSVPLITKASEPPLASREPEFVPENDYPFFGYHPAVTPKPPSIEAAK